MYFRLNTSQESELLNKPETGMGYQVIEALRKGFYSREKFLVLNSEIVIEMDNNTSFNVSKVIKEGINTFRADASLITLDIKSVLNESQFHNIVSESGNEDEKAAIENPVVNADGIEIFVRLSAFENDKRIDKINDCLLPGSYTTTEIDYLTCKTLNDDPVERYSLPNNHEVKYAFHIKPEKTDTLQKGKVQKAKGKRGGGKEVYFEKGTARRTFLKQTPY